MLVVGGWVVCLLYSHALLRELLQLSVSEVWVAGGIISLLPSTLVITSSRKGENLAR